MKIAVVGLGKLGAPLAAVFASKGHEVVGIDLNPDFVAAINRGAAPVVEPQLQDLIDASAGRLSASTDIATAASCEATFVIVPTPTDPATGTFTNRYVVEALRGLGAALRGKSDYHLVVVTSTVMPGSTDGEIREALEQASGRTVGGDLGLCYNPEFIALGSVVRNMLYPDFLLVGESDDRAGAMLESIYRSSVNNDAPVRRMNLVNAELSKISVNTYVTTKISYANMLADICERIPGADVDVVAAAIGCDSRIGHKYLRGSVVGYGGPCFPRDNVAFSALARSLGAAPDLAEATDRINDRQVIRLSDLALRHLSDGGTVAILGLSYKPDTAVIEKSQGVMLAALLAERGIPVTIHDPMAVPDALAVLPASVRGGDTAAQCLDAADVAVVVTPWPDYAALRPQSLAPRRGRALTIIDCWRVLPVDDFAEIATLVHPGKG